jgi:hypothetical protein
MTTLNKTTPSADSPDDSSTALKRDANSAKGKLCDGELHHVERSDAETRRLTNRHLASRRR